MKINGSTFPGGVHPPDSKQYSEGRPIETVPVPKQVAILMTQHIGAPCKPTVAKKDAVTVGQVIGASDAFVSAPIHSSISGTVRDVALASHAVVGRTTAVYIDADPAHSAPKQPVADRFGPDFSPAAYEPDQIAEAIHQAGIVGMGGAGFPTRVKVAPSEAMPKKVLVVNGCECEPFITCDYRLMLEWTWQVIAGIRLGARTAGVETIRIGIEDNKPQAIERMREALSQCRDLGDCQVTVVPTKYPQGGERQLINTVLGKQVPTGGIPPQIGVCVLNIATCAAIAEAVVLGHPLTHRVVTVTGRAIKTPGNYYVPIGMSAGELIEHCGGLTETAAKVIMGGPMTGFSIADLTTPISKTSGAITLLTSEEVSMAKFKGQQTPCIRCGRCLTVCPERINPTKIAHAVKHNRMDLAEQYHMSACIECGCCSYICPANIELTGYIKTGKILKARAAKRMA